MLTLLALFYFPPRSSSFPPRLCLLATPSSCWLRRDTSPAPRKIKQTPTTGDKQKTYSPITARVHHSEPRLRERVKKQKVTARRRKKTSNPFFFFPGLFFSVIVFSERLWLSPSHSFLAWGYPTATRWLRNSKHFSPWAGRAGLKRKGAAGVRGEMFPGSCCRTTGATGTELLTDRGEGRCCSHLKNKTEVSASNYFSTRPTVSPLALPALTCRNSNSWHAKTNHKSRSFFATTHVIGLKKSTQSGIYSNPWAEQTHHCKSHIFGGWTKKNLSYARNNSCLWAGDGSVLVDNVNIQISEQLQGTTQRQ